MSEIDAFPRAVLQHHYPETPLHGDFTTIQAGEYEPIDVLVGGTPCQSFSIAGLRGGMADARGNLALEYLLLAERLRPRWLVWENVSGVLSSNDGRDFGSFVGGLGQLGYGWAYRSFDAQYFKLAQRRERVFVVGCLGDWRRAAAVLFEPSGLRGDSPPRREAGERVAPTIESGANQSGGTRPPGTTVDTAESLIADTVRSHPRPGSNSVGNIAPVPQLYSIMPQNSGRDYKARPVDVARPVMAAGPGSGNQGGDVILAYGGNNTAGPIDVATAVNAHGGPHGRMDFESETFMVAHSLRADGFDASEDGTGRGTPLVAVAFQGKASSNQSMNPASISPALDISKAGGTCVAFHENQRAEVTTNDTAGSLKVGGGKPGQGYPAVQSGAAVRRLTPRECARLQGFPDDYLDITYRGKPAADGNKYKALGNSMAVPVMSWIGRRIAAVDGEES